MIIQNKFIGDTQIPKEDFDNMTLDEAEKSGQLTIQEYPFITKRDKKKSKKENFNILMEKLKRTFTERFNFDG